jgi:DNA repair exonuclease SbcCD ATPase subunit
VQVESVCPLCDEQCDGAGSSDCDDRARGYSSKFVNELRAKLEDAELDRDSVVLAARKLAQWAKRKAGPIPASLVGRFGVYLSGDVDAIREHRRKNAREKKDQWRNLEAQRDEWRRGYESMSVVADELKAERDRALTAARELREALKKARDVAWNGPPEPVGSKCRETLNVWRARMEIETRSTLNDTAWLTDGGDNG